KACNTLLGLFANSLPVGEPGGIGRALALPHEKGCALGTTGRGPEPFRCGNGSTRVFLRFLVQGVSDEDGFGPYVEGRRRSSLLRVDSAGDPAGHRYCRRR